MLQITTDAIVLHSTPYQENHRLLVLFSGEHGRLDAVAHGAQGVRGKLRSAAVPLANGEYVLSGTSRLSVVSFAPASPYYGAMSDYDAIARASFLCELCMYMVQPDQPNREAFALLSGALESLAEGGEGLDTVFVVFLLRLLDAFGFAPELNVCAECGADRGSPRFSREKGGLCCGRCAPWAPGISREVLRFLRDARAGVVGELQPEKTREAVRLLVDYACFCADRQLRSARFVLGEDTV